MDPKEKYFSIKAYMNFRQFVEMKYTLDDAYGTLNDFKSKFGFLYIPTYEAFQSMVAKSPLIQLPMSMLANIENTTANPSIVGKGLEEEEEELEKRGLAGREDPSRQHTAFQSVKHHTDMALKGNTEPIILVKVGNRLILLDGDHRLYAYALMNRPVPAKIIKY